MPRPKKFPQHKVEALEIYTGRKAMGEGVSALDIQVELEVKHPEGTASYRLIADWVKEFGIRGERQVLLDSLFEWHLLEEYGLPWSAGEYLLVILYLIWEDDKEAYERGSRHVLVVPAGVSKVVDDDGFVSFEGEPSEETREFTSIFYAASFGPPTARLLIWCWRVHQTAPDLSTVDVVKLAEQFQHLELAAEASSRPADYSGLEALLTCRPELDEERRSLYERVTTSRGIPTIPEMKWPSDSQRKVNES